MSNWSKGLGSGRVEYHEGVSIIHFGSPVGEKFTEPEDDSNVTRNISVKDWLEKNG